MCALTKITPDLHDAVNAYVHTYVHDAFIESLQNFHDAFNSHIQVGIGQSLCRLLAHIHASSCNSCACMHACVNILADHNEKMLDHRLPLLLTFVRSPALCIYMSACVCVRGRDCACVFVYLCVCDAAQSRYAGPQALLLAQEQGPAFILKQAGKQMWSMLKILLPEDKVVVVTLDRAQLKTGKQKHISI